jgi:hypothetical protein
MTPRRGVILLLAVLVLGGCGQQAPEPTADRAADIPVGDLALMVLPREELGGVAAGLRLSQEDSGASSNAKAALVSFDPEDTGETMRGAGRVAGFDLVYADTKLLVRKGKSGGVYSVGTSVELMEDPARAAQFLHEQMAQFDRFANRPLATGARISRVGSLEVTTAGEEAQGATATVTLGGKRFRVAAVAFRRGRLVGSVSVTRADTKTPADEAVELATKLDKRIQDALAGAIDENSSALPPASLRPLNLRALTLDSPDFPAAPSVALQRLERFGDVRAFYRVFDPSEVVLSGSKVLLLRAMTEEFESPRSVQHSVEFASTPKGLRTFAGIIARALGPEPQGLRVRLRAAEAGAAAGEFSFRSGKRTLSGVVLLVGEGRARGSITVIGPAGKVSAEGVLRLYPRLLERLSA